MVRMNFIFIFISSSDPNLLRKKSVKQKIKKTMALLLPLCMGSVLSKGYKVGWFQWSIFGIFEIMFYFALLLL